LLAPGAGAQQPQVTLRAALQISAKDPFVGISLVRFKEEVESRTGGAVAVQILDMGKPYPDNKIVGAVASGEIEMGIAGFHYLAEKIPAIDIIQQPFLFNFDALMRAAAAPDSEVRRLIDDAVLEGIGVRVLWWQTIGNQVIFSKKDVLEPQQIKGTNVRVFSGTMAQFTKDCGAEPAMLPAGKLHNALKDGDIDSAMAAISVVTNRELWKVSDVITRTNHSPTEYQLIVNEGVWRKLSPEHQIVIMQAAHNSERKIWDDVAGIEADTYEFARQKGMTIKELTPDQVAEWRVCSAGVLDQYMARSAELGRQLMAAYGRLRTQPCCSTNPAPGVFTKR
jgi:C4-dicarboxylate-binding protein DctP